MSILRGEDKFRAEVKEQQRTEEKSAPIIIVEADPPKEDATRLITTELVQPVETTDEQMRVRLKLARLRIREDSEHPPAQLNASEVKEKRNKRRILDLVKNPKRDVSVSIDNDTSRKRKRRRRD